MSIRHGVRILGIMGLQFLAIAAARTAEGGEPTAPQAKPRLGINLAGPADWNSEQPFVDVFRLSRAWISQREGAAWGQGPKLDLDERGWIRRLERGCWAETPLCTMEPGGHYPGGVYTVLHEGQGRLAATGAARVRTERPGRVELDVDPSRGGFFLQIRTTRPEDPVRNIRVLMPGTEKSHRENPWRTDFLDRWRGMACLRFMDLMLTNNSTIAAWSERPRLDDATFTVKGVPLELLIDLANRLDVDPWFCIPHLADDDYIRNFATMVKQRLTPKLRVYVEYSNEVWNGQFEQSRFAGEQGQKLGFAEKPWEAAWKYTAYRSVAVFKIFEEVFGGTERLVRVLPSQAANAYVAEQVVTFQDAYRHADALAIAPYLSFNVSPEGKPGASEVASWNVDQVLDHVEKNSLPESEGWIRDNQKVARKYGLKLVAYEAGQHLVGVMGGENNEALTRLLTSANRHPRLAEIYGRYFDAWGREGGDLLCYFSSVGPFGKYGSWGLLEFTDDDPSRCPKYTATLRWGRSLGQLIGPRKAAATR